MVLPYEIASAIMQSACLYRLYTFAEVLFKMADISIPRKMYS